MKENQTKTNVKKDSGGKKSVSKSNLGKKTSSKSSVKKTTTTAKKTPVKEPKVSSSKTESKAAKKVLEKVEIPVLEKDMEIKEEPKVSPIQNQSIFYWSIVCVLLAAILLTISYFKFFQEMDFTTYSDDWKGKSYLVSKNIVHQISLGEILNVVNKDDAFIFVTNMEGEEEFKLEKDLKKIVSDYHLTSRFFVYPLNSSNETKAYENLQVTKNIKIPTILYYRNGVLEEMVEREDNKMMEAADFVHLLDIYEFKK